VTCICFATCGGLPLDTLQKKHARCEMSDQSAPETQSPHINVGQTALDVTLRDEEGREVALSVFWRERPTFFVWVRHFG
jgi:hypothetical protein